MNESELIFNKIHKCDVISVSAMMSALFPTIWVREHCNCIMSHSVQKILFHTKYEYKNQRIAAIIEHQWQE